MVENCQVTKMLSMPSSTYDLERKQYLADAVLKYVRDKTSPSEQEKVLGITKEDLYALGLNFVFGEASPSSGKAVIGLRRLREEFYGRPKNRELFRERALKEAIHEIGHLIGLRHCDNPKCVMFFSNTLKGVW